MEGWSAARMNVWFRRLKPRTHIHNRRSLSPPLIHPLHPTGCQCGIFLISPTMSAVCIHTIHGGTTSPTPPSPDSHKP